MARAEGFALPVVWLLAWSIDAVRDGPPSLHLTDYCLVGPEES